MSIKFRDVGALKMGAVEAMVMPPTSLYVELTTPNGSKPPIVLNVFEATALRDWLTAALQT